MYPGRKTLQDEVLVRRIFRDGGQPTWGRVSDPMIATEVGSLTVPNPLSEPPMSPPDTPYREIQDEDSIRGAIGEVDELISSLIFLDRHAPKDSHFNGWRGGEQPNFNALRALRTIREDLEEMLEERV